MMCVFLLKRLGINEALQVEAVRMIGKSTCTLQTDVSTTIDAFLNWLRNRLVSVERVANASISA